MGKETDLVLTVARENNWPLRLVEGPAWKLWLRGPGICDWLVVGAHGCSEHKADIQVTNLLDTRIYFLSQRLAAAPGKADSWYVSRAVEGGRWSTTTRDWFEVAPGEWKFVPDTKSGLVEVFDTAKGERPFDYVLKKYAEDRHLKTITDMYEGPALRPFDAITLSKKGTTFGEILAWLSADPQYHYRNIVAGFCNSSSLSKFVTPFGAYVPDGALKRQGMAPPDKPLPQFTGGAHKSSPPTQGAVGRKPLPQKPGAGPAQPPAPAAGHKPLPRLPHGGPPRRKP